MTMPRWIRRLADLVVPFGAVERERAFVLRAERASAAALPPDEWSAGEQAVVVETGSTLAYHDVRSASGLLRAQQALVSAAAASRLARQRLEATRTDPRWVGHVRAPSTPTAPASGPDGHAPASGPDSHAPPPPPGDDAPDGRSAGPDDVPERRWGRRDQMARFREDFDPHQPLSHERVLGVIEFLFIVVEVYFWYGVFDDEVTEEAGLFDPTRVGAILLALLIPAVGVWAARAVGKLGHRWLYRYPGVRRISLTGLVASGLVSLVVLVAVCWLVLVRFSDQGFQTTEVPAAPMALVFGAVLVVDAVARAFLTSEIRTQTDRRARRLDTLTTRLVKTNTAHERAWLALRSATQAHLSRMERITAVGGLLLLDERALGGRGAAPAGVGRDRPAHRAPASGRLDVGPDAPLALPDPTPLGIFGDPLASVPLRAVEDAINSLDYWRPMTGGEVDRIVTELRRQLYGVTGEPSGRVGPDKPGSPATGGR
ncbi:hypothetical protein O7606_13410 [Micromonospora sp. WMMD882]|uniref:hypothetical protein n=1 Tax=Micromonospora sp. WMMD882 TaxID=3015151 RepID=UPI00248B3602|nr:hypothetical protein [Micromonospora sp. WMMD882]WBB77298.1 hypothetical protein O7606_13410 [Micromonospora sp. WMMD882]